MDIYIIRHGITAENKCGCYIGCRTDVLLAEDEHLKWPENIKIPDRVYCSPMKRCLQTVKMLTGSESATAVDEFREIDFGSFEGKNYEELQNEPDYIKWLESGGTIAFPEGESRSEFVKRNAAGLKKIMDNSCSSILIVGHGGTVMSLMSMMTGKEYFDFQVKPGCGYACHIEKGSEDEIKCHDYEPISCRPV